MTLMAMVKPAIGSGFTMCMVLFFLWMEKQRTYGRWWWSLALGVRFYVSTFWRWASKENDEVQQWESGARWRECAALL